MSISNFAGRILKFHPAPLQFAVNRASGKSESRNQQFEISITAGELR